MYPWNHIFLYLLVFIKNVYTIFNFQRENQPWTLCVMHNITPRVNNIIHVNNWENKISTKEKDHRMTNLFHFIHIRKKKVPYKTILKKGHDYSHILFFIWIFFQVTLLYLSCILFFSHILFPEAYFGVWGKVHPLFQTIGFFLMHTTGPVDLPLQKWIPKRIPQPPLRKRIPRVLPTSKWIPLVDPHSKNDFPKMDPVLGFIFHGVSVAWFVSPKLGVSLWKKQLNVQISQQ